MKVQILQNVQIYRRSGDGDTGCFAVCYMLFISTGIIIVAVCVVDKIQIIGIRRIKCGGNPLFAWVANRTGGESGTLIGIVIGVIPVDIAGDIGLHRVFHITDGGIHLEFHTRFETVMNDGGYLG